MNEQKKKCKLVSQSIKQPYQSDPLYYLLIPTQKTSIGLYFTLYRIIHKIIFKTTLQLQVENKTLYFLLSGISLSPSFKMGESESTQFLGGD